MSKAGGGQTDRDGPPARRLYRDVWGGPQPAGRSRPQRYAVLGPVMGPVGASSLL